MSMNCDGAGEEKEQEHGGKVFKVWSDHGIESFNESLDDMVEEAHLVSS